ncbi:hypothetical protein LRS11_14780 [Pseudomonas sp. J452]|uniref:hypothetical protein n=1 Tax=Pseudomonas sp. J452 TaxID=2898441 RepID=UPI0021ADBD9E|nr:hypothetical protein [Pseudomonas sp. J452]UUY07089.1 hypothetical protein LRS11_14780 [Pseudomonas sp. J452]
MAKIAPYKIIGSLLFLYSLHVQADWGINGIAAECLDSGELFELSPIVELSSPAAGEVKLKQGFRRLNKNRNELYCHVGQHLVKASIRVYSSDSGACMGAGYVSIDSLSVGPNLIIKHPTAFNWDCPGEQILVGLRITQQGTKVHVESCSAKSWGWDTGFQNISCTSKELKQ